MIAEWAFVALGSNVGDREAHLAYARDRLAALPNTSVRAQTAVEETEPIGPVTQGPYLNQMVLLATSLGPEELLRACLAIEQERGRVRVARWGPRTLDVDVVRFGDRRIATDELTLPHPEIANRPFWQRELAALEPLAVES